MPRSSPSDPRPTIYRWDNANIRFASAAKASRVCARWKKSSRYRVVARSCRNCSARSRPRSVCTASTPTSSPFRCARPRRSQRPARTASARRIRSTFASPGSAGGRHSGSCTSSGICSTTRATTTARRARGHPKSTIGLRVVARSDDAARRCARFPAARRANATSRSIHEIWARCYAQTVLLRSGDQVLERRLHKLQAEDDAHIWPADQFEPVAVEVERVFARLGLTQLSLPLAA